MDVDAEKVCCNTLIEIVHLKYSSVNNVWHGSNATAKQGGYRVKGCCCSCSPVVLLGRIYVLDCLTIDAAECCPSPYSKV